jgi:hypothetical protein
MPEPLKHPNRVSCWLRDQDSWLHDALDDLAKEMTEKGIKTTKSDLVRSALVDHYANLKAKYEQGCKDLRVGAGHVVDPSTGENSPD